jgi:hypothetical protein
MKVDQKSIFILLALNFLFSCGLTPQQIIAEKPVTPPVNSVSEKARRSTVGIVSWTGTKIAYGSGFFVAADKIATNIHVVARPGPIFAKSVDGKTIWAVEGVSAYDAKNDLVVLKIAGESAPLSLDDSDKVQTGEPIIAMGYPGGEYKVMHGTIGSSRKIYKWIRMKVDTAVGSSGGPVLNMDGQVIGIIVGYGDDAFHSYAIPANVLKKLLAKSDSIESLVEWRKRDFIRAHAYHVQGQKKYRSRDYKEAIADFDKAIQLNPDVAVAYYNRGTAKFRLAESEGAHGNSQKARELYQEAINDYTRTLEKSPWNVNAYRNRGFAKAKLGQREAAEVDFQKAKELAPNVGK